MSEMQQFETHMDRMERERQEQQAEIEKVRLRAQADTAQAASRVRVARWQVIGWWGGSLVCAVFAIGLAWIIWQANAGPSAVEKQEHDQQMECTEAGGSSVSGDCIMPRTDR